jgi:hypothetical protein
VAATHAVLNGANTCGCNACCSRYTGFGSLEGEPQSALPTDIGPECTATEVAGSEGVTPPKAAVGLSQFDVIVSITSDPSPVLPSERCVPQRVSQCLQSAKKLQLHAALGWLWLMSAVPLDRKRHAPNTRPPKEMVGPPPRLYICVCIFCWQRVYTVTFILGWHVFCWQNSIPCYFEGGLTCLHGYARHCSAATTWLIEVFSQILHAMQARPVLDTV